MYYTAEANVNSGTFLCPTTDHKNKKNERKYKRAPYSHCVYESKTTREEEKDKTSRCANRKRDLERPVAQKSKCTFRVAFAFQHLWPTSQPASQRLCSFCGWQREPPSAGLAQGKAREREKKTAKETKRRPRTIVWSGGIIESHQQHRFQPGHQAGLLQLVPFASSEIGRILVVSSNYHKFEGASGRLCYQPTPLLLLSCSTGFTLLLYYRIQS